MTSEELDLIPVEELLAAVKRRYNDVVFIGKAKRTQEKSRLTFFHEGCPFACWGLLQYLSEKVISDIQYLEDGEV